MIRCITVTALVMLTLNNGNERVDAQNRRFAPQPDNASAITGFVNRAVEGSGINAPYYRPFQEVTSEQRSVLEPSSQEFEPEEESESPFDEPIETDRHDFTQSPKVVGCGVRQFEYGFFYASKENGPERDTTYATPELMFRYGLTDKWEFRTRFNYAWKLNNEDDDLDGGEDLRLGFKYQLSEQCHWRPDSAIEYRLSVPTGASNITTGRWEPGIDFIYGWEIGDYFTLAGSSGANGNALGDVAFVDIDRDPNDKFVLWTQSLALGAKLTRKTTGYFEWFGLYTHNRDVELSQGYLNFGADYLLTNNCVIDFRIGWGLTRDSDNLFAGVGGAFRF